VYYKASYYDLANRLIDSVGVGANADASRSKLPIATIPVLLTP
jgi:hypothetical protein